MYYNNNNGTIYYEVHGSEDSPTIVFLHGVAMDYRTFKEQIQVLKDSYRVIVLDLPYHGKSSGIDENLRFSTTTAEITIGLLDSLNIEKVIIAGVSMGSFVTQQIATKYPHRVIATIHISGGSLYPKYPSWIKIFNPFYSFFINIYPKKYLSKAFAKHKAIQPSTIAYLEEISYKLEKKTLIHLIKEMINDMVQGIYEPLKQPMLLVYGDHELSLIKKLSTKWHSRSSNSYLVMIKNAHHITHQDNPKDFNDTLISYLEKLNEIVY